MRRATTPPHEWASGRDGRMDRVLPLHMGALHPYEQALTLLLAFGPFVALGIVVWRRSREDHEAGDGSAEERQAHVGEDGALGVGGDGAPGPDQCDPLVAPAGQVPADERLDHPTDLDQPRG